MTATADERHTQITTAATACFLRFGYQKTTMQEIARVARLSRPAIYQYFTDKPAIFRAAVAHLHDEAIALAEQELSGPGSLDSRLSAVFVAKYASTIDLIGRSPHAAELFDRNDSIAGDLALAGHARLERLLQTALRHAEKAGEVDLRSRKLTPTSAARLIDRAVQGLVNHALVDPTSWPGDLRTLMAVTVGGLRPA
jgi:AcrR family transcriptional regulator